MEETVFVASTGVVEVYLIGFNCLGNAAGSLFDLPRLLLYWNLSSLNFWLVNDLVWVLAGESSMSFCLSFSSTTQLRWLRFEVVTIDALNLIRILFGRQSCILSPLLYWTWMGRRTLICFTVEESLFVIWCLNLRAHDGLRHIFQIAMSLFFQRLPHLHWCSSLRLLCTNL